MAALFLIPLSQMNSKGMGLLELMIPTPGKVVVVGVVVVAVLLEQVQISVHVKASCAVGVWACCVLSGIAG